MIASKNLSKIQQFTIITSKSWQLIAVKLEDLELAISHFETVLEEDGDNVNAIQNIAQSYGRLNKAEMAEKWNSKV